MPAILECICGNDLDRVRQDDFFYSAPAEGITPQILQTGRKLYPSKAQAAVKYKLTKIRYRIRNGNRTDLLMARKQLIEQYRNRLPEEPASVQYLV